uniref:Uncharacterized protein n=1 Tax=Pectinophora gossypiella TaxID=13191 RepID=A0A1E1WPN7_PECGO
MNIRDKHANPGQGHCVSHMKLIFTQVFQLNSSYTHATCIFTVFVSRTLKLYETRHIYNTQSLDFKVYTFFSIKNISRDIFNSARKLYAPQTRRVQPTTSLVRPASCSLRLLTEAALQCLG